MSQFPTDKSQVRAVTQINRNFSAVILTTLFGAYAIIALFDTEHHPQQERMGMNTQRISGIACPAINAVFKAHRTALEDEAHQPHYIRTPSRVKPWRHDQHDNDNEFGLGLGRN